VDHYRYEITTDEGTSHGTVESHSLADATNQVALLFPGAEILSMEQVDHSRLFEPSAPRPPDAPRDIDVKLTDVSGGMTVLGVGGLFSAVGLLFLAIGVGVLLSGETGGGIALSLFSLVFVTIGGGLLANQFRQRSRQQRLYRNGQPVLATVEHIGPHPSVRINGVPPMVTSWSFEVDGQTYSGKRAATDPALNIDQPGDAIWVIYDAVDPTNSTLWPPPDSSPSLFGG